MIISKSKIYSSIKWNSVAVFFNVIIAFAQMYILFRLLSKEDFGLMATITAAYFYLRTINTFKVGEAIMHTKLDPKWLSSLFWLLLMGSIFCYGLILFLGPFYAKIFDNIEVYHGLLMIGVLLFFDIVFEIYRTLLHKELYFKILFKIAFIGKLLYFVLSIFLALNGFGYKALLFAFMSSVIVESVLSYLYGRKLYSPIFHFNFQELKPILRFGGYSTARRFLREFRNQLDTILIGRVFGLEILGVYNIFKSLFLRFVKMLSPLFANVTTPILVIEKKNISKTKFIFYKQNRIYNLIAIPFFVGFLVYGKTILKYYFGESYIEHLFLFQLMTAAFLLSNPVGLTNTIVVSYGKVKHAFLWTLLSLIMYILVVTLFLNTGIEIFAIGLIVFFMCKIITVFPFIIQRSIGGNALDFFNSFSRELLISIFTGILFYGTIHFFNLSDFMIIASMFIYGLTVMGIFIFNFKSEIVDFLDRKKSIE